MRKISLEEAKKIRDEKREELKKKIDAAKLGEVKSLSADDVKDFLLDYLENEYSNSAVSVKENYPKGINLGFYSEDTWF